MIYLDYNATTPIAPEVAKTMEPFIYQDFGNPSSSHSFGKKPKEAVQLARVQIANLLGCKNEEIFFTSGGTESNNWAIKGVAQAYSSLGKHIITSSIEHPAVKEVCEYLSHLSFTISEIPVSTNGVIDLEAFQKSLRPDTILVTIMHANNEVGTIQPIEKVSQITKKFNPNIIVHTDAAQSIGKIPTRVRDLGVDLLTIVGHKLYAPKGVGALYVKEGVKLGKFMHGAGQENGWRAGTENVILISGLGKACELISQNLESYASKMKNTRDQLVQGLKSSLESIVIHGESEPRLPNTASVGIPGVQASELLVLLNSDIAASAGSACHSNHVTVSPVLKAMNVASEFAFGTLRLSTGRETEVEDINRAVRLIVEAVRSLLTKK
eukprot:TRINITY_DN12215_c0_g1_i1.p1 TRINITY_DN12215_c0_g1~~TRINITY_DN12215_c0_g1_i1.p1  ORF type:complete len:381 (-),score=62.90 TRINITY_DN12215_c0_g1_i1:8-1150(-)